MPELPEVEALKIGLKKALVGSKILKASVKKSKIVSSSGTVRTENIDKVKEFETQIIGKTIVDIDRRAKNIIIKLSDKSIILVHLKMTGQMIFHPTKSTLQNQDNEIVVGGHPILESQNKLPNKHTQIIFDLNIGTLYYNDVRQFGYVLYYKNLYSLQKEKHFENLGTEPLSKDFNLPEFSVKLKQKNSPIKTVLLDQSIYCDEVCFASGILPSKKCNSLSEIEISKLFFEIKRILHLAIKKGGSSVANYLLVDGTRGNYADFHLVYGKKNQKCSICGENLLDTKISGRTTIYCRKCQS